MPCKEHCTPEVAAHVQYAQDIGRYILSVAVTCSVCTTRFKFLNVKPGIDFDGVRASPDFVELHAGIHPAGLLPPPLPPQGARNG